MNIKILEKVDNILDKKIRWAIFVGIAVAVYNGSFFRENNDIDIIIENDNKKINEIFQKVPYPLKPASRSGRNKYSTIIDGWKVEFMVMVGKNKIDLANGSLNFDSIEINRFEGVSLPVIDLQSLYKAKLSHKESLESEANPKHIKMLKNTLKDIETIKKILNRLD